MPHRNHIARNPLLRKGGAHVRSRSSSRQEQDQQMCKMIDEWNESDQSTRPDNGDKTAGKAEKNREPPD